MPAADDDDVIVLGEVTREQRDAEGRAAAMDLDEEGDDAASAGGVGSEDEAVCGGAATSELPQDSQELELSQD